MIHFQFYLSVFAALYKVYSGAIPNSTSWDRLTRSYAVENYAAAKCYGVQASVATAGAH